MRAIHHGDFLIHGLRNRDLQTRLYESAAVTPAERRRRSSAISRQLRLLRAHRILQRVPHTHPYQVTDAGRVILIAVLTTARTSVRQLNQLPIAASENRRVAQSNKDLVIQACLPVPGVATSPPEYLGCTVGYASYPIPAQPSAPPARGQAEKPVLTCRARRDWNLPPKAQRKRAGPARTTTYSVCSAPGAPPRSLLALWLRSCGTGIPACVVLASKLAKTTQARMFSCAATPLCYLAFG